MVRGGISLGAARIPGVWETCPASTRALLIATALGTALGVAVLLSMLIQGCGVPGSQLQQHATCTQEQWQVMAAALVAQLSFAAVTAQAIVAENADELRAAAAINGLVSGLLWLLFLAVVGRPLSVGSRVGWGLLTVVCTAAQFVLLHLTYNQLGWRQHSWLSCDPRRKHAAQQQELWRALNRYLAYSRSCLCILALSFVNGLVLALTTNPADSVGAVVPMLQARLLQDTPEDRMKWARVGVLVSVGLTVLPMLWLVLARCAVHYGSQKMEFAATITCIPAGLLPAFQFYFAFSDYFLWPQCLVVRLLLLAGPMGVWMGLLAVTLSAFRRVMSILRQPWVLGVAACGGSALLAARGNDGDTHVPQLLKPLMQGAWLLKHSTQSAKGPGLRTSKPNSRQGLSIMGNPSSSSSTRMMTSKAAAAAAAHMTWQSFVNFCSSRKHYRFFQLSLDGTTLRWSWNKYVLLYFVDSLTCDPTGLHIILHCVLEPDLHLAFRDAATWQAWVNGLQLALQLSLGLPAITATAPVAMQDGTGGPDPAAATSDPQLAGDRTVCPSAAHAVNSIAGKSSHPCPVLMQHQMVRSALYSQQSMQRLQASSCCCMGQHAGGCTSWLGLPPLLCTSRRHSQYDPANRHLAQAQEMAQNMQAIAARTLAAAAMAPDPLPMRDGVQAIRCTAGLQHAGDETDAGQQPPAGPQQTPGTGMVQSAGSGAPNSAQARATGASTMFGAFKIPASLQVDHWVGVPQLIAANSSSGGTGSGSSIRGDSKPGKPANYSYLPQTVSSGSSSGGASAKQPQAYCALNAGYCLSPLGLTAAQRQEQQHTQLQAAVQHMNAHLPPGKKRQLLQWLQQQSSGSCPESDGPQMSPCYSLDSAQQFPSTGASLQVLPLLQQQQCAASPASGGSSAHLQPGSGAEPLQGVLQQVWSGTGSAHWAAQSTAAPAQQRGQYVGSKLGPAVAAMAFGGSEQTHMPFSKLHISRSVSLPATHGGTEAADLDPAYSSQAAIPSDAAAQQPFAQGADSSGATSACALSDDAAQPQCNSNSGGYSGWNNASSAEMCSSEERCHVVLGPGSVRQLAAHLQGPPAASASSAQSSAAAEKQQKVSWGTASFRSIAAGLSAVTQRSSNRSRTVSVAGTISEQAVAAPESSSTSTAPEAAASEGSDHSSPADKTGASMRRRDSSFSMRPSCGSFFGSFAGRSTWSDFEPPFSVSVATANSDDDDDEGGPAPAAAAEPEAAAAEQQQLLQQDGWRTRTSKEKAAGLTPVLSANSEDLQRLAAQEQHQPAGQAEFEVQHHLADNCSFRMPLVDEAQAQEQVRQALPTDEAVFDMQAAYQLALRSSASEGGRKATAEAQAAVLPTTHSIEAHSAGKQPASSALRTQSWLIASAPAAAAAAELSPMSAPAAASAAPTATSAVASGSAEDAAFPPFSVHAPSPSDQTSRAAGDRQRARLPQALCLMQQHGSQPLSAAAGAPQTASAPQLHHDGSYAVKSLTPSAKSLSGHFSHASIVSNWWLDGCEGSPSAAYSRQQTPPSIQSDQLQLGSSSLLFQPGSSASGAVASTGFRFPAAVQSCGSPVGAVLVRSAPGPHPGPLPVSPAAAASPLSARISAGLAHRPAVSTAPSSALGVMEAARRLSNTASLKRGDMPQAPVEVIPWRKLHRGRRLGQGSEGTVLEASYMDNPVAIKEGVSDSEIDMFLSAGSHDNLVGLRGLTQKSDGSWCLVLEHCGRGTLDMLLHHFRTPLARAPPPLPPPTPGQLAAAAAAAAAAASGSSAEAPQQHPLTRPDVVKCLRLMRGVGRGLLHLHTRQPAILHRDIKPANIFVGYGMQMKIGDLGMARFVFPTSPASSASRSRSPSPLRCDPVVAVKAAARSPQHSHGGSSGYSSSPGTPKAPAARTFTPGIVGTITYTAPEVLGVLDEPQEQPDVEAVLKADVYSFGVTLWESIECKRPWQGLDGMQLWTMWVSDPANVKLPPLSVRGAAGPGERAIFVGLQSLVNDCTALDPMQRPTMEVVVKRISCLQMMYAALLGGSATGSAASNISGEPASDSGVASAVESLSVGGSRTQTPDADAQSEGILQPCVSQGCC